MKRFTRVYPSTTTRPEPDMYDWYVLERQMGIGHYLMPEEWEIDHFELKMKLWKQVARIVTRVDYGLSFLGFFINILHLMILTRKELRSNVVYIIMTGICLCDLSFFVKPMVSTILESGVFYRVFEDCDTKTETGRPYFHTLIVGVLDGLQTTSRASSALLSLAMTSFRAFSVKFPLSSYVTTLMKPRNGVLTVIVICALCTFWKAWFYAKKTIEFMNNKCKASPDKRYYLKMRSSSEALMIKLDGYFEVLLTIAYIIVTSFLLIELGRAHRRRKSLKSDKSENSTSKLIIWMSVFFFLSHFIFGVYYLIDKYLFRVQYGFENLETVLRELSPIFQIFMTVNSSIHCVICLLMSAQYRDTGKQLFYRNGKQSLKVSFVGPLSTPSVNNNTWKSEEEKSL